MANRTSRWSANGSAALDPSAGDSAAGTAGHLHPDSEPHPSLSGRRACSADGDDWLSGGCVCVLLHLLGQPHGFFDEGVDDVCFGDGLDDLAADEDLAL